MLVTTGSAVRRIYFYCAMLLLCVSMISSGPGVPVIASGLPVDIERVETIVAAIEPVANTDHGYREVTYEAPEVPHPVEAVVAVAERPRPAVRAVVVSRGEPRVYIDDLVPEEFRPLLLEVTDQLGVDPRIVASVIMVESHWVVRAQGRDSDLGLMQIIPPTAAWIAKGMQREYPDLYERLNLAQYDLFDARTNITMGTWYLKVLYREYGDWSKALAAYNAGPRGAARGAEHPYVGLVMRWYRPS